MEKASMYCAIAQIIKNNRELRGWTQLKMAKELKVSRRKYQAMESGDVSLEELCQIAEMNNQVILIVDKQYIMPKPK